MFTSPHSNWRVGGVTPAGGAARFAWLWSSPHADTEGAMASAESRRESVHCMLFVQNEWRGEGDRQGKRGKAHAASCKNECIYFDIFHGEREETSMWKRNDASAVVACLPKLTPVHQRVL